MTHLRHGYTLADLDELTTAALRHDRSLAMNYRDRRDIAWSAIAEALYAAEVWPRRESLVQVGWQAIYAEVRKSRQEHGYRGREWDAGHGSAPHFAAYWFLQATVTRSHEERVVERAALPAILSALTDGQRQVLGALAAFDGDRSAAAAALGCTEKALNQQLLLARRTCLALWLEHETPRRVPLRRLDARRHRREVAPCGTSGGVRRHRTNRESLCELCAPVGREYDKTRKAKVMHGKAPT